MCAQRYNLTPQRRVVLGVVRESNEHLTAREILERGRKTLPRLSYATVYNALSYLTRAGLLHEISFASGASRYDRRDPSHGHAICEGCGQMLDLELPDASSLVSDATGRIGFEPDVVAVTVYGRCRDCRERPRPSGMEWRRDMGGEPQCRW